MVYIFNSDPIDVLPIHPIYPTYGYMMHPIMYWLHKNLELNTCLIYFLHTFYSRMRSR